MLDVDPLHFCIALGPLAAYLLLLGAVNLSSRPFLTNGARDTAALGIGILGFAIVGPMELFLPERTAFHLGAFVWVLLLVLYSLSLTLCVLLMRPRLVIYNIHPDQVRPLLASLVPQLDREARWAGQCLIMPTLGIQLHVELFGTMRNAQLVAAGPQQSYEGWQKLELEMSRALKQTKSVRNPYGFSLVFAGLVMITLVTALMVGDPETVVQSLHETLRIPSTGE
ncbi:MAG: hypothetical protein QGH33_10075 [Pirellulaceae bacterium]|jgi:hypothetical protein|nr:hypothetical protein [Pirellulaceae bacterium]HJN12353.1 hypothetical protein [Pirellulaceae bacterium]